MISRLRQARLLVTAALLFLATNFPVFQTLADMPQQNGTTYTLGDPDCGSTPTAFCSPDEVLAALRPGDTLIVAPGPFSDRLIIDGINGTADTPITIRGRSQDEPARFDGGCQSWPCSAEAAIWDLDWGLDGWISVRNSSPSTTSSEP